MEFLSLKLSAKKQQIEDGIEHLFQDTLSCMISVALKENGLTGNMDFTDKKNFNIFDKHFRDTYSSYGYQVVALNLLYHKDDKPTQNEMKKITRAAQIIYGAAHSHFESLKKTELAEHKGNLLCEVVIDDNTTTNRLEPFTGKLNSEDKKGVQLRCKPDFIKLPKRVRNFVYGLVNEANTIGKSK